LSYGELLSVVSQSAGAESASGEPAYPVFEQTTELGARAELRACHLLEHRAGEAAA